ncbi:MAG TPA: hypothetical protein VHO04_12210 [Sphingopyxis sp.]|uniref:hypothetical protein n=1 Tax=Sphingopyxis sp. TaxID=1908224 RepID=UPI002E32BAD1|nr:hypothetical protein [Sphingopyxis sp.]HEX2813436.1 hypothetical protein [Sphingopyxis sp.]
MTMPTSKLATLFYTLAIAHLLFVAYGAVQAYGADPRGDARFDYFQFTFPSVIYTLMSPAFCVLAGLLAQTVKNASDFMAEQVERRDFEQAADNAGRIGS